MESAIEGSLDVKIGGKFELVYQAPTWKENTEKTPGLAFKLEGKLQCALTGQLVTDEQLQYAERLGPRRVYHDGRPCLRTAG